MQAGQAVSRFGADCSLAMRDRRSKYKTQRSRTKSGEGFKQTTTSAHFGLFLHHTIPYCQRIPCMVAFREKHKKRTGVCVSSRDKNTPSLCLAQQAASLGFCNTSTTLFFVPGGRRLLESSTHQQQQLQLQRLESSSYSFAIYYYSCCCCLFR